MLSDPDLNGVAAILFDEFHERHIYGDISLARALELQATRRPDLRIGVMSATLDGEVLERYLDPCVRLESSGRTYPVEIRHLPHEPRDDPPWELAADAAAGLFEETGGDMLVFMPGAYEIGRTIREVHARLGSRASVLPLHGELPPAEQDKAVSLGPGRKIIVSTNVAETSLTIEGVRTVIDSGLARVARFDPHRGINTLLIEPISRASADQRAGRAGRVAPGLCVRLWTGRAHSRRPARDLPEVLRLDLSETVLTLKASGVRDVAAFRWIDPPSRKALGRAEQLLADLGALGPDGAITDLGLRMLRYPVHPRYARMFLAAGELGCLRAAALLAALTQSRPILMRAERRIEEERIDMFGPGTSDFFLHMRAYAWARSRDFRTADCRHLAIHAEAARQVDRLFAQFLGIAGDPGTDAPPPSDENIARCILAGFADQVARRRDGGTLQCDIVHGRRGELARNSAARNSSLFVAAEINEIEGRTGEVRVLLSMATEIQEAWLREMFPGDFSEGSSCVFDRPQNRVVLRRCKRFRDLVLESRDRDAPPSPSASACLASAVASGDLRLNGWTDEATQFVRRVNFLAAAMPESGIRPIGPEERTLLIAELCDGCTCYREIKDRPVLPALRRWLTPHQLAQLDSMAPERIPLPSGRRAKITYPESGDPTLSARIQDLYGMEKCPVIAAGRVVLTVEILAPNHRPVQVTRDLHSFWTTQYPKLRTALQRRYPKHEWRQT
jgi:ATP-dependent helicase HrpB